MTVTRVEIDGVFGELRLCSSCHVTLRHAPGYDDDGMAFFGDGAPEPGKKPMRPGINAWTTEHPVYFFVPDEDQ